MAKIQKTALDSVSRLSDEEREELFLYRRKLMALCQSGLGEVGACREMFEAGQVIKLIDDRLNLKPVPDIVAQAKAAVAGFGLSPWVQRVLSQPAI